MPHFIIEVSENLLNHQSAEEIMQLVHDTADGSNLFDKGDIKLRVKPYSFFNNGNLKTDFIHVFGHLLEGRTVEQKANLTKSIVNELEALFPDVPIISMNLQDIEKASYFKKQL